MINNCLVSQYDYFHNKQQPIFDLQQTKNCFATTALQLYEKLDPRLHVNFLIDIFFKEVCKHFPVSGVTFYGQNCLITAPQWQPGKVSFSVEILSDDDCLGRLQFDLFTELTNQQAAQIMQLSHLLDAPLHNAIQSNKIAAENSATRRLDRHQCSISLLHSVKTNLDQEHDFALFVLDLPNFKSATDSVGQQHKLLLLKRFCAVLYDAINRGDRVFRCGDEQFVMLLNTPANLSLDKVEQRIKHDLMDNVLLQQFNVTCNMGIARFQSGDNFLSLFNRLDKSLQTAPKNYPFSLKAVK